MKYFIFRNVGHGRNLSPEETPICSFNPGDSQNNQVHSLDDLLKSAYISESVKKRMESCKPGTLIRMCKTSMNSALYCEALPDDVADKWFSLQSKHDDLSKNKSDTWQKIIAAAGDLWEKHEKLKFDIDEAKLDIREFCAKLAKGREYSGYYVEKFKRPKRRKRIAESAATI